MKIVRLVLGILVALMAITFVTEAIEFTTVKLVSGESYAYLSNNQQEYFRIRNQPGVLIFKVVYNFIAALTGGFLVAWISGFHARIGLYILIGIQTLSLVWAGFFSELSGTGPIWMWVALIVVTPVGIYLGYRIRTRNGLRIGQLLL